MARTDHRAALAAGRKQAAERYAALAADIEAKLTAIQEALATYDDDGAVDWSHVGSLAAVNENLTGALATLQGEDYDG